MDKHPPSSPQTGASHDRIIAGAAGAAGAAALGWWWLRRRQSGAPAAAASVTPKSSPTPRKTNNNHDHLALQLTPLVTTLTPLLLSWLARRRSRPTTPAPAPVLQTPPTGPLDQLKQDTSLGLLPPTSPDVTPDAGPEALARPVVATIRSGPWHRQAWQFTNAAINAWLNDFAPSMGAAIAYYTIFSIAPILVIAIAVAGMIFGQDAAQGEIVEQIRSIVGNDGAVAVQGLLRSVSTRSDGVIATVLSLATLAVGATAVFAELQSALDRIWRIPVAARSGGVWQLVRTRLLSFGLILGLGFMLMVSLVVSAGLAALGKWWGSWFAGWEILIETLNFVISFLVFTALFSAIYKFMPRVRLSWHDVRIGAVATTVLFIIGKYLIGLYLGKTGMSSGFGAAGSFALLLAWIYYSAQIFLLGAEFTWIYANSFGSRRHRPPLSPRHAA